MKYAIPAAVLALLVLCLWALSVRRRLTALRLEIDQALERFHAQQFGRINALAELVDLTNEYAPGAVRVRGDVVLSCCTMITQGSSLSDIGKRERTMSQILSEIIQAAQTHPEMRSDARYFKRMNDMSYHESLSNTNRLLYNASVNKLNRELRRFPVSARVLGFQKQEYIEGPANLERVVV